MQPPSISSPSVGKTQLQEEGEPPKAAESPKQSSHYQSVFFLLNLSYYGRTELCEEATVAEPEVLGTLCSCVYMCVCVHEVLNLTMHDSTLSNTGSE